MAEASVTEKGRWASEAAWASGVFLAGAVGAWAFMAWFGLVTGANYSIGGSTLSTAISLATGHGFATPEGVPAVTEFIDGRSPALDPNVLEGATFAPANSKFELDRYYLITAISIFWRIFGISWTSINFLLAFLYGLTALAAYGILRLGMGRVLSVVLLACWLSSPLMLTQLPSLRELGKAPFILFAIFACGLLVSRTFSPRQYLAMAIGSGVVVGIGIGFRQDSLICVPPVLGCLAVLARGGADSPLRIPVRIGATGAFLLAVFIPASPGILMTLNSGGNNAFYLTQGWSQKCLEDTDMVQPWYTQVPSASDNITHGYITHYYEVTTPAPVDQAIKQTTLVKGLLLSVASPMNAPLFFGSLPTQKLMIWGYQAEMTARVLFRELVLMFPADTLVRWYASVLRNLRGWDSGVYFGEASHATMIQWDNARAPFYGLLDRTGVMLGLIGLLLLCMVDVRLAFGAVCIVVYFLGYPSLEYQIRHSFHLTLAPFWFLGLLLAVGGRVLWRRQRPALRSVALGAGVYVAAIAMLAAPVYALLPKQSEATAALRQTYAEAELESIPFIQTPDEADRTRCMPEVRRPTAWENGNWGRYTGMPVDVIVEYLVLDLVVTEPRVEFSVRYDNLNAGIDHFDARDLPQGNQPVRLRVFTPIFEFPADVLAANGGVPADFTHLELSSGVQVEAAWRVRRPHDFPYLMNIWLADEGILPEHAGLRLF